jgi:Na+(H+)/acetate symporter ActP
MIGMYVVLEPSSSSALPEISLTLYWTAISAASPYFSVWVGLHTALILHVPPGLNVPVQVLLVMAKTVGLSSSKREVFVIVVVSSPNLLVSVVVCGALVDPMHTSPKLR